MAKIIGICELGGYLGHISKITSLLQRLHALGHEVVAVLPDISFVGFMQAQEPPIAYVLGPKLPMPAFKTSRDPVNLSEVLLCAGLGTDSVLTPCAHVWRQLLTLLKADLILADYAPTPLLAARSLGLPAVVLGTGFSVPPPVSPLPAFNRRLVIQEAALKASDEQLLAALNRYLAKFNAPLLNCVSDLFWQTAQVAITHAQELDHFAQGRPADTQYYGLATQMPGGLAVPWPAGQGKRVFAYLKTEYTGLEYLLTLLAAMPVVAVVYISGAQAEHYQTFATERLQIYLAPVDLTELMPQAEWLIYHAGSGMASQALVCGKPSILIPTHYEQLFTAEALASRHLGYVLNPHWPGAQIEALVRQALQDIAMEQRCAALAGAGNNLGQDELVACIDGVARHPCRHS
ncbi:MAG TPA: glycosyltransferase [Marinagarivorans sp.]|nr:glycosyltransferase [Marinagarivorans sp.]HNG58506.1 glycosyltransferase [Cellvibrionaceae bacterium]